MPDAEWCWSHHPDYQEARRRRASKGGKRGGRGRPVTAQASQIGEQLADLYQDVLAGRTEPKVGAVLAQIANARARIIETRLKVKEQAELEERLEALERRTQERNVGKSRWG